MIKAVLKNYRQSPRKVRLIADSVRGKNVNTAITQLMFTPKRSALPIKKLIESAVANAKHNHGVDSQDLFIKTITVNDGFTMKRWRPRARGAAFPIRKRTSHVSVVLDSKNGSVEKAVKTEKKEEKQTVKKAPVAKKTTKKVESKKKESKSDKK